MRAPRLIRRIAALRLALVDAEVAYYYVHDGQLSEEPLNGYLDPAGRELRERRLAAVRLLERLGGHDPAPTFTRPPTSAQRAAYNRERTP